MDCNSTGRSLKLARKLLGLPEPEIEPALPYLLDALRDTDLRTRETAKVLVSRRFVHVSGTCYGLMFAPS